MLSSGKPEALLSPAPEPWEASSLDPGGSVRWVSRTSPSPSNCNAADGSPLPHFSPACQGGANLPETGALVGCRQFSQLEKYIVFRLILKLSKRTEWTSQDWLESQSEFSEGDGVAHIQTWPGFTFTALGSSRHLVNWMVSDGPISLCQEPAKMGAMGSSASAVAD